MIWRGPMAISAIKTLTEKVFEKSDFYNDAAWNW